MNHKNLLLENSSEPHKSIA